MKVSPQRGGFRDISSCIPSCPVSTHVMQALSLKFYRAKRSKSTVHIVMRVSCWSTTKEMFSCLTMGFLFDSPWLEREHMPCEPTPSVYMNMCILMCMHMCKHMYMYKYKCIYFAYFKLSSVSQCSISCIGVVFSNGPLLVSLWRTTYILGKSLSCLWIPMGPLWTTIN